MFIRYFCANCGQKFKSEEEHSGKIVNCAKCGVLLEIPRPEIIPAHPIEIPESAPQSQPPVVEPKFKLRMKKVEKIPEPEKSASPPSMNKTTEISVAPVPVKTLNLPTPVKTAENSVASAVDAAAELAKYGTILRDMPPPKLEMPSLAKNKEESAFSPVSTSASGTISTPFPSSVPIAVPIDDDDIPSNADISIVKNDEPKPGSKFPLALIVGVVVVFLASILWTGLAFVLGKPLGAGAILTGIMAGCAISLIARERSARAGFAAIILVLAGIITGKLLIAEYVHLSSGADKIKSDRIFYSPFIYDDMLEKGEIKDPFEKDFTDAKERKNLFSSPESKALDEYNEQMRKIQDKLKNITTDEEKNLIQRMERYQQFAPALTQEMMKKGETKDPFAKTGEFKITPGDRPSAEHIKALRSANIESIKQQRLIRNKLKTITAEDEKRLTSGWIAQPSTKTTRFDRLKSSWSYWDILWVLLAIIFAWKSATICKDNS